MILNCFCSLSIIYIFPTFFPHLCIVHNKLFVSFYKLQVVKEIEELPVLKLFMYTLCVFEGGHKKERISRDHVRRVGRLLYEVETTPKSVRKLWQLLSMNQIRNNFFAGNDLLGDSRRKPQTLKSYIFSYRLFLKFCLSSEESIRVLEPFGDDDRRQVRVCNLFQVL